MNNGAPLQISKPASVPPKKCLMIVRLYQCRPMLESSGSPIFLSTLSSPGSTVRSIRRYDSLLLFEHWDLSCAEICPDLVCQAVPHALTSADKSLPGIGRPRNRLFDLWRGDISRTSSLLRAWLTLAPCGKGNHSKQIRLMSTQIFIYMRTMDANR